MKGGGAKPSARATPASPRIASALAIGGLDPGGGAGIAADLRAFAAAGVFGCAAVAVVTVQSTNGLRASRALSAREVSAQAREVLGAQRISAIKIGALGSAANVRAVSALLALHDDVPAIVDPVMLPTRGHARLLRANAQTALITHLVPRAWLVTANAPEASALTGASVRSIDEAREAACAIVRMGARAALVKGGHLRGDEAIDVLALGASNDDVTLFRGPRLTLPPTHGGGCILASLIAGRLAKRGDGDVRAAVRWAKRFHARALAACVDVGGAMRVLVP